MNNSFDLLLSELDYLISTNDYEAALSLMKKWLDSLAVDYRLHGKVFDSSDLDLLCLKIGAGVLKSIQPLFETPSDLSDFTVFVVSELHLAGGHTKLLEDYLRALRHKNIKVLVTDPANNIDRRLILEYFTNLEIEFKFSPRSASLQDKLKWLMAQLARLKPKECYLLSHANDPVAVAGMQKELVPILFFVHHCDHTLTLGINLHHSKHLDFRLQGFNNCRNNLGIDNILTALVAPDLGCPHATGRFLNSGFLRTCTSGGYKFEIPYAFNLLTELPKWLKITNGIHTHIGNLSASTIKILRGEFSNLGISQERLRIIPFTKNLWTTLIDQEIDLYISSFPVCGARSIVEAMGAGVPTTVHHNYATPMWSNVNFAYPQAHIWREPDELQQFLSRIDKNILEQHSQFARDYYLKHHHPDQLTNILQGAQEYQKAKISERSKDFYKTNALKAFIDQFAPIPFRSQRQREVLSQFIAVLRIADALDIETISYLKNYLAPHDYHLFKDLMTEIQTTCSAINSLNNVYPILREKGEIDMEKFTNLLYKLTTSNSSQKNGQNYKSSVGIKLKTKLFYNRLKAKYNSLIGQNN